MVPALRTFPAPPPDVNASSKNVGNAFTSARNRPSAWENCALLSITYGQGDWPPNCHLWKHNQHGRDSSHALKDRKQLASKPQLGWVVDAANSNGPHSNGMALDFDVLIIGGGFSGTMLAIQLLRRNSQLKVAVVDKGKVPGRGLAYSSHYRFHVLNVPAGNMSALPGERDHFFNWARDTHDSRVRREDFLPREIYGRYLGSFLEETVAACAQSLTWFRDEALALSRSRDPFRVRLQCGRELSARSVVVATGNLPPGDPSVLELAEGASRYMSVAWSDRAFEGLRQDASVLLIGAGLTAVDLAIGFVTSGFQGKIHMLSRRGVAPQSHAASAPWPQFWNNDCPRTVRGLLRLIRREVRAAAAVGTDWRSVIDAIRPVTQDIWRSLPTEERKRFVRHLRSYWDSHRHRVAPELADLLSHLTEEGQIQIHGGRITHYREDQDQACVTFRRRQDGQMQELRVDRVINCTGPEANWRRIDNSLLNSLFAQGLAKPDPLFLGLDVDSNGAALDEQGLASKSLFAIGPVRKGNLWETTAVPELRNQAADLAEHIVGILKEDHARKKSADLSVDQPA
jgi:uncharacterized NAD(P)/FAD-binding protein YdhS